MFLHYFKKKENKDKVIANNLYNSIVQNIKTILSKKEHNVKNDFNSSFELATIIIFCIFYAYDNSRKNKLIKQYLMDTFILDLDQSLRNIGIGDNKISKYVKKYVKKTYYRIYTLDKIFKKNDYKEFCDFINKIDINVYKNNSSIFSQYIYSIVNNSINSAKNVPINDFRLNIN